MSSTSFLNNFINFIAYMARVLCVCVREGHTQCQRESSKLIEFHFLSDNFRCARQFE